MLRDKTTLNSLTCWGIRCLGKIWLIKMEFIPRNFSDWWWLRFPVFFSSTYDVKLLSVCSEPDVGMARLTLWCVDSTWYNLRRVGTNDFLPYFFLAHSGHRPNFFRDKLSSIFLFFLPLIVRIANHPKSYTLTVFWVDLVFSYVGCIFCSLLLTKRYRSEIFKGTSAFWLL